MSQPLDCRPMVECALVPCEVSHRVATALMHPDTCRKLHTPVPNPNFPAHHKVAVLQDQSGRLQAYDKVKSANQSWIPGVTFKVLVQQVGSRSQLHDHRQQRFLSADCRWLQALHRNGWCSAPALVYTGSVTCKSICCASAPHHDEHSTAVDTIPCSSKYQSTCKSCSQTCKDSQEKEHGGLWVVIGETLQ